MTTEIGKCDMCNKEISPNDDYKIGLLDSFAFCSIECEYKYKEKYPNYCSGCGEYIDDIGADACGGAISL